MNNDMTLLNLIITLTNAVYMYPDEYQLSSTTARFSFVELYKAA